MIPAVFLVEESGELVGKSRRRPVQSVEPLDVRSLRDHLSPRERDWPQRTRIFVAHFAIHGANAPVLTPLR